MIRFYAIKLKPYDKIMSDDQGRPLISPYTIEYRDQLQSLIDNVEDDELRKSMKIIKMSEV